MNKEHYKMRIKSLCVLIIGIIVPILYSILTYNDIGEYTRYFEISFYEKMTIVCTCILFLLLFLYLKRNSCKKLNVIISIIYCVYLVVFCIWANYMFGTTSYNIPREFHPLLDRIEHSTKEQ